LAGGGGWRSDFVLNVRAFLALRQLPGLAEGAGTPGPACVRVCVCVDAQCNRFSLLGSL
jgi:hypothetical protein